MDLWQRAKEFAEDAAKRSQEISKVAAQRSQELTKGAAKFSQEFVHETAKKTKELAAEASKKADLLKVEASKKADLLKVEALVRADQIKSLAGEIPMPITPLTQAVKGTEDQPPDLEEFGITEDLKEFLKGITQNTFKDFPMEDEPEIPDVPMVSNVRQDLNEWQARHATLILSAVKEISKLRYELCPRYMKEKKFWQIYFVLVNSFVTPFERQYMEFKLKTAEKDKGKAENLSAALSTAQPEDKGSKLQSKTSSAEQDLDVFLLGDGSSDEGPDDGDNNLDDFDKI